jgi:hypothetical protein
MTSVYWSHVQVTSGCWPWTGYKNAKGYGFHGSATAHAIMYKAVYGPVPRGMNIDHVCNNTSCVKPSHLAAVTPRANVLRGKTVAAFNAAKTHCKRGHEFTEDNIYRSKFGRQCKTCVRARQRKGVNA